MTSLQNVGLLGADRMRRLAAAVVRYLLERRERSGAWRGELASSPLATATACVALKLAEEVGVAQDGSGAEGWPPGVRWLIEQQNADGGWGDAPGCRSNISATLLALAALKLAGERFRDQTKRAIRLGAAYVERCGGLEAVRNRYGSDRTFVVPILSCLAIAEQVSWDDVPGLPFELGILPHALLRWLRVGVVSYALPALLAIGYGIAWRRAGWLRRTAWPLVVPFAMRRLRAIQPDSGGYLEAVPLTAFVCMSLMVTGRAEDAVVRRGVAFLRRLQRPDGSWPVDVDLSCWLTSLALQVLGDARSLGLLPDGVLLDPSLRWLLSCQWRRCHPYTAARPGGWGWTDQSGAVPDADDTPAALLAVRPWAERPEVTAAACAAVDWLLRLQNRDGGWPTFCRGWGWLPFDRSAPDLTAHVLRALEAWCTAGVLVGGRRRAVDRAIRSGLRYLLETQRHDGSFVPLWFGSELHPAEENPLYGTARVLLALIEVAAPEALAAAVNDARCRAVRWLLAAQRPDGGWGASAGLEATVEETGLALAALARLAEPPWEAIARGVAWLEQRIDDGVWTQPTPIGLYFAKLWYSERLYPVLFATHGIVQVYRALVRAGGC